MSKEGDILVDSGLAMVIMLMAMWGVEWLGEVAVREVVSILMIAGIVLVALQLVEHLPLAPDVERAGCLLMAALEY